MNNRTAVAGLALAAATLVGIAVHEGYSDTPIIPIPGDVPTIGFGETKGVKAGDRTTPTRALVTLLGSIGQYEAAVKRCAPVPMHPYEYAAFVSLTYNIGSGAFCSSTIARKLNALDYAGACLEILRWDRAQGRIVRGLTERRQAEYKQCIGATP
jgi:lysozyme